MANSGLDEGKFRGRLGIDAGIGPGTARAAAGEEAAMEEDEMGISMYRYNVEKVFLSDYYELKLEIYSDTYLLEPRWS